MDTCTAVGIVVFVMMIAAGVLIAYDEIPTGKNRPVISAITTLIGLVGGVLTIRAYMDETK